MSGRHRMKATQAAIDRPSATESKKNKNKTQIRYWWKIEISREVTLK